MSVSEQGKLLGARVRQARLNRDLTQVELARRAGVEGSTVHRIEKGHVARPEDDTIAALAQVLHVDAQWLTHGVSAKVGPPVPPTPVRPNAVDMEFFRFLSSTTHRPLSDGEIVRLCEIKDRGEARTVGDFETALIVGRLLEAPDSEKEKFSSALQAYWAGQAREHQRQIAPPPDGHETPTNPPPPLRRARAARARRAQ